MTDWAIDFGSGYGQDCNRTLAPLCETVGAHLLSVPNTMYIPNCCKDEPTSLVSMLRNGQPLEVITLQACFESIKPSVTGARCVAFSRK
jgi:hypothetical protein